MWRSRVGRVSLKRSRPRTSRTLAGQARQSNPAATGRIARSLGPIAVALGGLVVPLVVCAIAQAGTWALVSCTTPAGQPAPADGWLAGGAGTYKGAINTCATAGGALIAQVGDETEQPAYQPATWTFTAPAGATIAGGTLTLGFFVPEGQGYAETPQNSYDSADVVGNCQYNVGSCGSQWNEQADPIAPSQTGGTQIFLGAECVASVQGHDYCQQPGDPLLGADGLDAQSDLYSAVIDLQDSSTPSASGFTGGLLAPSALGTADLLFTASDPNGPGILRATVTIDGAVVYNGTPDTNGGRCQSIGTDAAGSPEYLYAQPCKQSVPFDVPVNTATLPAGEHQLRVTLTDAAGNTAVVYSQTITTATATATATSDPNLPNGTPCAAPQLSLSENGKSRPAPVRWGMKVVIAGWLHCGQTAIPGATVTLSGDDSLGSLATSADGRFTLVLPRGPTRTLHFAYRAYSQDSSPTTTQRIKVRVYPRLTLQITPRATVNGRSILWRGTIAGGPYPPGGLTLLVEVREGRRWRAFDEITTSRGAFAYRYTFLRTTHTITYEFRVAMPNSGAAGYDYLPAASRTVKVRVAA